MRKPYFALACMGLTGTLITNALGDDWPSRSITLVVPYAAGGPSDVLARLVAAGMSEILGRPLIIEDIGGAGGTTAVIRVARAKSDGYQIVLGDNGTFAANQTLYKQPPYNATEDFLAIGLMFTGTRELIVRKGLPANTLPEFITYAKANQHQMTFGSGGIGSPPYLACLMLNAAIGISTTHVSYRGAAPAMQDLIGERLDYMCEATPTALPQIQDGKVKAVAHLSLERTPVLPNLATADQQGLAAFDADSWAGLFVPKGTPTEIVHRLNEALGETLDTHSLRERFQALGVTPPPPMHRSPEYLTKFVSAEIERWGAPIRASGVSMD